MIPEKRLAVTVPAPLWGSHFRSGEYNDVVGLPDLRNERVGRVRFAQVWNNRVAALRKEHGVQRGDKCGRRGQALCRWEDRSQQGDCQRAGQSFRQLARLYEPKDHARDRGVRRPCGPVRNAGKGEGSATRSSFVAESDALSTWCDCSRTEVRTRRIR